MGKFSLICFVLISWALGSQTANRDSLLSAVKNHPIDSNLVIAYNALSESYVTDNNLLDSAIHYAQAAYDLSAKIDNTTGKAEAAYNLAYAYDFKGSLTEALDHYELARQHYVEIGDDEGTVSAMNGRGVACYFKGDYSMALSYFLETQKFANEHGLIKDEANALSNIGVIYRITEKYDQAIDLFEQNVRLRKQLGDSVILAKVYNNLGVVYTYLDNLTEAIVYLDSSRLIYEALRDTFSLGAVYVTIGDAYLETGRDLAQAKYYLEQGYDILKGYDDNVHQSKALLYLGRLSIKERRFLEAEHYLKEGLKVLKGADLDDVRRDLLLALSEVSASLNNSPAALRYLKESTAINDSLMSNEKVKYMEEMQAKFESEEKENAIEQLQSQNAISELRLQNAIRTRTFLITGSAILGMLTLLFYRLFRKVRKQKDTINESLHEKEHLIQNLENARSRIIRSEKMASIGQLTAGIAHEINNPINYISNNAEALQMDLQELTPILKALDEYMKEGNQLNKEALDQALDGIELEDINDEMTVLLKGIANGADRTSEIVKGLRYLSYVDKGDKEVMDIHEALDSALSVISSAHDKVIDVKKMYTFSGRLKVFPGQINQLFINIISNAFQSMEDNGILGIETKRSDTDCIIIITDTGHGMTEETKEKIFEPFYTTRDIGKGTGLGLSISYNVVENHGGRIKVESTLNLGTTFTIILPVVT